MSDILSQINPWIAKCVFETLMFDQTAQPKLDRRPHLAQVIQCNHHHHPNYHTTTTTISSSNNSSSHPNTTTKNTNNTTSPHPHSGPRLSGSRTLPPQHLVISDGRNLISVYYILHPHKKSHMTSSSSPSNRQQQQQQPHNDRWEEEEEDHPIITTDDDEEEEIQICHDMNKLTKGALIRIRNWQISHSKLLGKGYISSSSSMSTSTTTTSIYSPPPSSPTTTTTTSPPFKSNNNNFDFKNDTPMCLILDSSSWEEGQDIQCVQSFDDDDDDNDDDDNDRSDVPYTTSGCDHHHHHHHHSSNSPPPPKKKNKKKRNRKCYIEKLGCEGMGIIGRPVDVHQDVDIRRALKYLHHDGKRVRQVLDCYNYIRTNGGRMRRMVGGFQPYIPEEEQADDDGRHHHNNNNNNNNKHKNRECVNDYVQFIPGWNQIHIGNLSEYPMTQKSIDLVTTIRHRIEKEEELESKEDMSNNPTKENCLHKVVVVATDHHTYLNNTPSSQMIRDDETMMMESMNTPKSNHRILTTMNQCSLPYPMRITQMLEFNHSTEEEEGGGGEEDHSTRQNQNHERRTTNKEGNILNNNNLSPTQESNNHSHKNNIGNTILNTEEEEEEEGRVEYDDVDAEERSTCHISEYMMSNNGLQTQPFSDSEMNDIVPLSNSKSKSTLPIFMRNEKKRQEDRGCINNKPIHDESVCMDDEFEVVMDNNKLETQPNNTDTSGTTLLTSSLRLGTTTTGLEFPQRQDEQQNSSIHSTPKRQDTEFSIKPSSPPFTGHIGGGGGVHSRQSKRIIDCDDICPSTNSSVIALSSTSVRNKVMGSFAETNKWRKNLEFDESPSSTSHKTTLSFQQRPDFTMYPKRRQTKTRYHHSSSKSKDDTTTELSKVEDCRKRPRHASTQSNATTTLLLTANNANFTNFKSPSLPSVVRREKKYSSNMSRQPDRNKCKRIRGAVDINAWLFG